MVYKVTLQPTNTSNYFEAGHRIRPEVSSSNCRASIKTGTRAGGKNYDESHAVVAHNAVQHCKQYHQMPRSYSEEVA
ncbi:MAG: hypothetical protein AABO41_20745 [Acidobacteriota bacterium]